MPAYVLQKIMKTTILAITLMGSLMLFSQVVDARSAVSPQARTATSKKVQHEAVQAPVAEAPAKK